MAFDWDRSLFKNGIISKNTNLDLDTLKEAFEKSFSKYEKSFKTKKSFSPSSFGGQGACPRYWYFAFNGADFIFSPDALGVFAMESGIDAHERLQKRLYNSGIVESLEHTIENKYPPIFGFADVVGEWSSEKFVGEIKSVGADKFDSIAKNMKPPPAHLVQILIYMKVLKLASGVLIYLNRDSGKLLFVPVNVTPTNRDYVEYLFKWMTDVNEFTKTSDEPPSRGFTKSTWQCKSCPVRESCDAVENVKKFGPMKLELDVTKLVDKNETMWP